MEVAAVVVGPTERHRDSVPCAARAVERMEAATERMTEGVLSIVREGVQEVQEGVQVGGRQAHSLSDGHSRWAGD